MVFPLQVDRQIYHAAALEVVFQYVVDTLRLPGNARDDVQIGR